jgi:hypothetical protein
MYGENGELLAPHQMPVNVRAAIAGIDTIELPGGVGNVKKVKLVDKSRALDMLMKHTGGYEKDNSQKSAKLVVIDIIEDDDELPTDTDADIDADGALPNQQTGLDEDEFIDE